MVLIPLLLKGSKEKCETVALFYALLSLCRFTLSGTAGLFKTNICFAYHRENYQPQVPPLLDLNKFRWSFAGFWLFYYFFFSFGHYRTLFVQFYAFKPALGTAWRMWKMFNTPTIREWHK